MPKVGKREFPYTRKGQTAAKKYSKAAGKPVRKKRGRAGY
jgi:hypothetical protein